MPRAGPRSSAGRRCDGQSVETEPRLQLGRIRLSVVPDVGAGSLEPFVTTNAAADASIRTDGGKGCNGLAGHGFTPAAVTMSKLAKAELARTDPLGAAHPVFSHVKRWLLGTHHGGQSHKHLQRDLDELVFRFNRRRAVSISRRFDKLLKIAVETTHTPYRRIVGRKPPNLRLVER